MKKQTIYQKVFETTTGLFITFLLSAGLIGGSSYFLFESQIEKQHQDQTLLELNREVEKIDTANEFVQALKNGWVSPGNVNTINAIALYLAEHKDEEVIDITYSSFALGFCKDAYSQLAIDKGKIDGFFIEIESIAVWQRQYSELYREYSQLAYTCMEVINDWQNYKSDERQTRVRDLYQSVNKILGSWSALNSGQDKFLKNSESYFSQVDLQFERAILEENVYKRKRSLYFAGIVLGSTLLIWILINAYRINKSPPKAQKDKLNKKKRK